MTDKHDITPPPASELLKDGALKWNIFKEIAGLGIAEGVSMATSLGVVAIADQIAPELQKKVSKAIAKTVIEPYLDTIETNMKRVCKLQECQPDMTKSREERAESLASTMLVFGAAWVTSMAAKIITRKGMNHAFSIPQPPSKKRSNKFSQFMFDHILPNEHDTKVFCWDEGVHIGSLLLMNTVGAKHTDNLIYGTSTMLQHSLGMSKKRADAVASMAVIWEVPNVLGFGAGAATIARDHLKKAAVSHVEKLAESRGLSEGGHTPPAT